MIPRKLNKETLDILCKEVEEDSQTTPFRKAPYTYADGTTVNIAPALLINASTPVLYLIKQTYPYHDRSYSTYYSLSDLAFIVTEDGKKIFWTRDAKTASFFAKTACECMGLKPKQGADGKIIFKVEEALSLTFNNERMGQYECDFMRTAYERMGLRPIKGADENSLIIIDNIEPTFYNEKTGQYEYESKIKMTPEEMKERLGKMNFDELTIDDVIFISGHSDEFLKYSSNEQFCKYNDALHRIGF